MPFRLPRWDQLSKDEQIPIYNLPMNGTFVVTGGPGTGKTVLAIHRAARIKHSTKGEIKVKMLVFNRILMNFLKNALIETKIIDYDNWLDRDDYEVKDEDGYVMNVAERKNGYSVETMLSWFYRFYMNTTGTRVPEIAPYKPDWEFVFKRLDSFLKKSGPIWDHLIIDETQDFPKELLQILRKLTKNTILFADPNQAITDTASDLSEIVDAFEAYDRKYPVLTRNYRNTKQIYELAKIFYSGDPEDIPPVAFRSGRQKPALIKCVDMYDSCRIIKTICENNPEKNIGVFLPSVRLVKEYYREISKNIRKNYNVQKYYFDENKKRHNIININEPGLTIMTYWTIKGLEFDIVILPELQDEYFSEETNQKMNQVYVGCTRARDELYFINKKGNEGNSFVIRKLIENKHLLKND